MRMSALAIIVSPLSLFAQKNEGLNPGQIDFSQDHMKSIVSNSKSENKLPQFLSYDCSSVWTAPNIHLADNLPRQNGVIGNDYQRIQIYISRATKSKDNPAVYLISGKSKVKNNICDFSGEVELLKLYDSETPDTGHSRCASLVGKYIFYEDSTQKNSGFFQGIMDCTVYIDAANREIKLDDTSCSAYYYNRSFVGIWTSYTTKLSKKCIWGDDRLPYTFDFSSGDGVMIVREKYAKNGWESYNNGSEYVKGANGKWTLKDKWWLRK